MNHQSLTSLFPLKSRVIEVECTYKQDPRKRTAEPLTPLQMEFLQKYHPLAREQTMPTVEVAGRLPEELRGNELPESITALCKVEGVTYVGTLHKQPTEEE